MPKKRAASTSSIPTPVVPERGTHRELFVVVAIVFGLMGALVLAIDPATQARHARDARRLSDSEDILAALTKHETESGFAFTGTETAPLLLLPVGYGQVIVADDAGVDCAERAVSCGAVKLNTSGHHKHCVANLSSLVPGDLLQLPIDPVSKIAGSTPRSIPFGPKNTGYFVRRILGGGIEVGPCFPEGTGPISVRLK